MIVKRDDGDYPKIYRPCRISEVYGQEEAKMIVGNGLDKGRLPQVLMFHGFSGTGRYYDYGNEGFSKSKPDIDARHWLGIEPDPLS